MTDFGLQDTYVGVMKGVIAQINAHLPVIDISHMIPPQNIVAARFHLMTAYPHFPNGTVHVAVVDPGVGTERRAIALQLGNRGYVVAPDNGLVSGVLDDFKDEDIVAVELNNPDYWYTSTPSHTFHGRDIFAAVGAHLASGIPIHHLGTELAIHSLVSLSIATARSLKNGMFGEVQHIDGFGNLITNIPGKAVADKQWAVQCQSLSIPSCRSYNGIEKAGNSIALIGSHGWIELAVSGGNAARDLGIDIGEPVIVRWD
jgi:S-adenosylmethionine hydrolase